MQLGTRSNCMCKEIITSDLSLEYTVKTKINFYNDYMIVCYFSFKCVDVKHMHYALFLIHNCLPHTLS